jgi:hypothetical protein
MALMGFREKNLVKWVGVRPAHRGTQLEMYGEAENATVGIYTVPVGSVFYLHYASLVFTTAAVGKGTLYIDNGALIQVMLGTILIMTVAGGIPSISCGLTYPIELVSGWRIRVNSDAVGLVVRGSIVGWLE